MFSGKRARGIRNRFTERIDGVADELPGYPVLNSITGPIRARARALGDPANQSLWSGQAASVARPGPAADIVDRFRAEVAAVVDDLGYGPGGGGAS